MVSRRAVFVVAVLWGVALAQSSSKQAPLAQRKPTAGSTLATSVAHTSWVCNPTTKPEGADDWQYQGNTWHFLKDTVYGTGDTYDDGRSPFWPDQFTLWRQSGNIVTWQGYHNGAGWSAAQSDFRMQIGPDRKHANGSVTTKCPQSNATDPESCAKQQTYDGNFSCKYLGPASQPTKIQEEHPSSTWIAGTSWKCKLSIVGKLPPQSCGDSCASRIEESGCGTLRFGIDERELGRSASDPEPYTWGHDAISMSPTRDCSVDVMASPFPISGRGWDFRLEGSEDAVVLTGGNDTITLHYNLQTPALFGTFRFPRLPASGNIKCDYVGRFGVARRHPAN